MTGVMKKGAVALFVVFVGFYMFTDPDGLAEVIRDGGAAIWEALETLFGALIEFIDAVLS